MLDSLSGQRPRYIIPALGRLYASLSDFAWLVLRVTVGGCLIPHGMQKLFMAFCCCKPISMSISGDRTALTLDGCLQGARMTLPPNIIVFAAASLRCGGHRGPSKSAARRARNLPGLR